MALIFSWPRREHYRLVPQEPCGTPWGIRGDHIDGAQSLGYVIRSKVGKILHSSF